MTLTAPLWHPLSERQTLFWLDEQLFPDAHYNDDVISVDLNGPLDVPRFVEAWDRSVAELDAFAITVDTQQPRQSWTAAPAPLAVSHVGNEPGAVDDWIRRRATRSLWSRGRLWDAALLIAGNDHHVFYLCQHQIVFDGPSGIRVLERVAARYAGQAPSSPRSFRSYLDVEASYRASQIAGRDQAYWSSKLERNVPPIRLYGVARTDRSVVLHRRNGDSGADRARRLASLSARAPFDAAAARLGPQQVVMTTALAAFLARVTGNRELLIAIPYDGRPRGYETSVGAFTEQLFLRIEVEENDTFASLAARVAAEIDEASRRGRACISNRGLDYVALTMLPPAPNRFGDVAAEVRIDPAPTLRAAGAETGDLRDTFGLQVCENGPDRLAVALDFHGATFPPAVQSRAVAHFWRVADAMVANPETLIEALDLPEGDDHRGALETAARGEDPGEPPDLVEEIVATAARRAGHVAVDAPDGSLTYAELDRLSNQLAHRLISLGVKRDTCVGISLPRGLAEIGTMLATLKAGGAYVPLDPGYPPERLRLIVEDAGPQVMVVHPGSPFADRALLPPSTTLLVVNSLAEIAEGYDDAPPQVSYDPAQLAYVLFTSGSTGRPKGVEIQRGAFSNFLRSMAHTPGITQDDRLLAVTTTSFDIAELELFLPLWAGATVIIADRETAADPRRLRQTIEKGGITFMQATPASWRLLLEAGWTGDGKIRLLCGGEAMSPELADKLTACGRDLWNMYGPTETTIWSSLDLVERGATRISVGKPIDRTQMYVLDAQLRPVPTGVVGELYIGGHGLARGYRGRPDLTAERFVDNPQGPPGDRIYRTGDLARVLDDGRFECLGRIDHQVKIRGFRIELGEIESVLRAVPGVDEALVIADSREGGDPQLAAYWVGAAGPEPLSAEARRKLPAYMVPSAYVHLPAFPLTPSGKIDRKALPRPKAVLASSIPLHRPRNDVETRIAAIWCQVLGLPQVGIDQDFFSLGGNSVLAIQLRTRIEQDMGVEVPLSTVLSDPTVERMAKLLEPGKDVRSSMVRLRDGGPLPPLFFIHDGEGEILPYRNLALRISPDHPVYGIQPQSRREHPILHTRLSDLVRAYIDEIRKVQPQGPYLLAGLCTGGFIAFEIARQLTGEGQSVPLVAVIDGAHACARRRSLAAKRFQRFSASLTDDGTPGTAAPERLLSKAMTAAGKISRLVRYEATRQTEKLRDQLKVSVLRFCGDRDVVPPAFAQNVPVRVVLDTMEQEYVTPERYTGEVVLYRATKRDAMFDGTVIDDTPYVEMFEDPMLGWKEKAALVKVEDAPGGHSSMLVPPYVDVLAESVQSYIDAAMTRARLNVDVQKKRVPG